METITYEDKVALIDDPSIADINKVTADDMNEIKRVVNANAQSGGGGESLKVGTILEFAGDTPPTGYLLCDGSAVSRTTYSDLFNVIGTTYGTGDGSTTFNLPNLKGRVPVGLDSSDTDFDTLGETGGSKYLQRHKHQTYVDRNTGTTGTGNYYPIAQITTASNYVDNNICEPVGDGNSGNLQPYIVVNYIIKASAVTPTTATVVDTYSESTTDAYSANFVNGEIEKIGKLLWSGNFTSGSITVPGLNDYNCIAVSVGGVLCIGNKNYGGNNYVSYGALTISNMAYRVNTTGDTMEINSYDKGGSNGTAQQPITAIYGIF